MHVLSQVDSFVHVASPDDISLHRYCITVLTVHVVSQFPSVKIIISASNKGQAATRKTISTFFTDII